MISIVICSINPAQFTRIARHYQQLLAAEPHEIIGVHDAKSLCEGYNRGLAHSRGDIVIFSHDDIEIWTPEFTARLKRHLQQFDCVGVAGSNLLVGASWCDAGPAYAFGQVTHLIPGGYCVSAYGISRRVVPNIQGLDGLFLAFRREAIVRVGWDDVTFDGFHGYDVDCTYRAYRMGLRLAVAIDLPMLHMSHGNYGETWRVYANRFMAKHGATLAKVSPRRFQWTAALVGTKEDAISVMNAFTESTT